ncbi:MAG: hypothetical protein Q8R61_14515 [Thiobacillus sp.]|uniref:hypothetical protein n=1 Tax=Thiobacillus sp. TaxID=924 RepID=UPI0027350246|nr:hypothetical protein [Thiobacillus sp.]MDP3586339.1 hypothetical protein [Thiobacillus sp.]
MSEPNDFSANASTGVLGKLTAVKLPLWVSLALVILWAISFAWQSLAQKRLVAKLETDRAAMTAQADNDRQALLGQLRTRAGAASEASLREFGTALAWAVRGEMIRNNLDQVDQFFTEIVKLPGTERALLAGVDGKIAVSTDRRHLGAEASTLVPPEALLLPQVTVRSEADGTLLLVVPVMGLNDRLGTVFVTRRPADAFEGL